MENQHPGKIINMDTLTCFIGSCDCLTKTPDIKYHKPGCKYRLISERNDARSEAGRLLIVESQQKDQFEAMREAIGVAYEAIAMARKFSCVLSTSETPEGRAIESALSKLQPFLKP